MITKRATQHPFQETRRSRRARYAHKEGRILGRFVKVPSSLLAGAFGNEVVAVIKAGKVRYVISAHGEMYVLSREATGAMPRHSEVLGGFPPGTGRLDAVKRLRDRLDRAGGGYNRILYAVPAETPSR